MQLGRSNQAQACSEGQTTLEPVWWLSKKKKAPYMAGAIRLIISATKTKRYAIIENIFAALSIRVSDISLTYQKRTKVNRKIRKEARASTKVREYQ